MMLRRLQKVNNSLLWQAIPDELAKSGVDNSIDISISSAEVKTQRGYIMFNNEFIINRNIRKTLKKLINFWNIKKQISHRSLKVIKDFTFKLYATD
ncbi:hypothetical protein RhiirA4_469997 [Rhizophagus irregularis]|uniref:Uncharacterized protein n=1 Tax=Rhizophagus irregularis TaxID=588596 RepID=A0A2I1H0G9_9GLOM|nr:hypothetical protein RhiirA4_469997 [Rhizophagus irregularis]